MHRPIGAGAAKYGAAGVSAALLHHVRRGAFRILLKRISKRKPELESYHVMPRAVAVWLEAGRPQAEPAPRGSGPLRASLVFDRPKHRRNQLRISPATKRLQFAGLAQR